MKNRTLIIVIIALSIVTIGQTVNFMEVNAENKEIKNSPTFQADVRLKIETENWHMHERTRMQSIKQTKLAEQNKFRSEHIQRCEKKNKAESTRVNCKSNWKNYPKK